MSVVQACAEAQAIIDRARSLFAAMPEATTGPVEGDGTLAGSVQSTVAVGGQTAGQLGELIIQHRSFVDHRAGALGVGARSDAALNAHLTTAAAVTQTGAARLAGIAAENWATSRAAATVSTPAGQRAILNALRAQLSRASDVVNPARQQAAGLAAQIRVLQYPHSPPRDVQASAREIPLASLHESLPSGPIVWCLRPPGTFGFWRCSVLYPDLSVGAYWSPTDDSGGSLP